MDYFMPHKGGGPVPIPDDDFEPLPPAPLTLAQFQARVSKWRAEKIPGATLIGQLRKLIEEGKELVEKIDCARWYKSDEVRDILREAADVLIVACNVADLAGVSLAEITEEKQAANEARLWKADGGKAQHVEAA